RHVAEGLKIRRGHEVRRIEWGGRPGVAVETSQGNFEADFAVVTLPLGVLKQGKVEFQPALPENKQTAIGRLGLGLLNKTYLRFPRQFWPARADWLGYVSEPRGRWSEYFNVAKFADRPILLGFNAAAYARKMEKKTDNEAVSDMMSALQAMFGRRVPDPTAFAITRWASDPFSYGSYSFMKVGATPRDYDALAEPLGGRLFFAGEHTNRRYAATVHGAYLSGQRAARQLAAAAKK
ncbi:MAG TPA: FAD-dependent oxidoreductase, partial [Pirellulales bacterium]|nr:FAD-dependent oxidoreductase [Pirellulales bacterium]